MRSARGSGPFDLAVVGTGFGSSFFLHRYLELAPPNARVVVVERGPVRSWEEQVRSGVSSAVPPSEAIRVPDGHKPWNFTIGFGGGTNCWWGQAPRMLPSDFRLRSLYGVGRDWPVTYDDLESHYVAAERIMAIAGDGEATSLLPRSSPYPQPPHLLSEPDRLMRAAYPDLHVPLPTARARTAAAGRPACCARGRCNLCPIGAKFTALNGMTEVYSDPRVEVRSGTRALAFETAAGRVSGVRCGGEAEDAVRGLRDDASTGTDLVEADVFVLGANALFSPAILQRSGITDGPVGAGLHEQLGYEVEVLLAGVENYGGSTVDTGLNYALYDGEHRRSAGASLLFFSNHYYATGVRLEFGRWRESLRVIVVTEDLPRADHRVSTDPADPLRPVAHHPDVAGAYGAAGVRRALDMLPRLLAPLPVESIRERGPRPTESHVLGTLPMGQDPSTSVVDRDQVHHHYRNLIVVGTSVFPTGAPANPSLTAAALSLRAAERAMGPAAP
ncbi:MAG TPA: GMC family oxidoreductase [Longimicrobiales bacterium]|jgi:choline dehydrogenase-like flavoprotein